MVLRHQQAKDVNIVYLPIEDGSKIFIASSLSKPIQNEIKKPLIWTLEYRIPFAILEKYSFFFATKIGNYLAG